MARQVEDRPQECGQMEYNGNCSSGLPIHHTFITPDHPATLRSASG